MPNQRTRSFLNKIFIFPAHKSCRNPLADSGPGAARLGPSRQIRTRGSKLWSVPRVGAGRPPSQSRLFPPDLALGPRRRVSVKAGKQLRAGVRPGSRRLPATPACPPYPPVSSPVDAAGHLQTPHPRFCVAHRLGQVRAREFHSHEYWQWPRGAPGWAWLRGTGLGVAAPLNRREARDRPRRTWLARPHALKGPGSRVPRWPPLSLCLSGLLLRTCAAARRVPAGKTVRRPRAHGNPCSNEKSEN